MERNIVCVKWGDKYSANHVNRLERMVQKNTSVPFSFYCMTEDPTGVNCKTIPLDASLNLHSWWWKISLFKDNTFPGDLNFYLDLDVVIQNNIDHLLVQVDQFTLIDFSECDVDSVLPINSSIMKWGNNSMQELYNLFIEKKNIWMNLYHGLDGFIFYEYGKYVGWDSSVYYSRLKGNYIDEPNDGKVKHGKGSFGVHYYPEKLICIFNQANEEKFYQGYEKYFL